MINLWSATLSVNAGLALTTDGLRIWVDAVHDRQVPDFSTLNYDRQIRLFQSEAFRDPDIIAFTHCHPDHYSEALCRESLRRYPQARLVMPESRFPDQILLSGQEVIVQAGGRLLTFRRLLHEGSEYAEVPHYGLMIEDGGENILVLGDCAVGSEDLKEWVAGKELDAVFTTFPWITLERGRQFVREHLHPRHLFVYHLPLAEDDIYGYGKAAAKAAAEMTDMEVRLFTEAFQQELF